MTLQVISISFLNKIYQQVNDFTGNFDDPLQRYYF